MKIDLVYLYVNSNDPEWIKKRKEFSATGDNQKCRFRDNNELRYSLRSVEKNISWINKIFIVSNSCPPDWLNLENKKIRWVDHKEFMPEETYPCFNSNVIEAYIALIPELSEYFIYLNDDMMFGRKISPSFFFRKGKPIVRLCQPDEYHDDSYYAKVIERTQRIMQNHYNKEINLVPWHCFEVYRKSLNKKCLDEFYKEFEAQNSNHLRNVETDVQKVIFSYYYLYNDVCYSKIYDHSTFNKVRIYRYISYFFPSLFFDYFVDNVSLFFKYDSHIKLIKRRPKVFCINDDEKTTENDLDKLSVFFDEFFQNKSSFEK